jgi:hypothetical protein
MTIPRRKFSRSGASGASDLRTGKVTIYVDEPLEVGATPAGEVVLKFACGQLGNFERAAMAVAVLSPAVARRPKAIFPNIESIADTPLPTHDE